MLGIDLNINSVCEKFQTTRAKVAPVNLIYGSHFSVTEATYKVSLKMVNFVEFTRTSTRTRHGKGRVETRFPRSLLNTGLFLHNMIKTFI